MNDEMIQQTDGAQDEALPAEAEAQEAPEQDEQAAESVQDDEIQALRGEVAELRLRLSLLTGGAAPEKLDEGVKLAAGIMAADGCEPQEAAEEVLREYPHIRLARRSVPQFSAESRGSGDGFAAIRSIFARK